MTDAAKTGTPAEISPIKVTGEPIVIEQFKKRTVAFHHPAVVRARLAMGLLLLLASVVAVLFLLVIYDVTTGKDWTTLKDLFSLVLTPIATLAGTAFGFFFATNSPREDE